MLMENSYKLVNQKKYQSVLRQMYTLSQAYLLVDIPSHYVEYVIIFGKF